MFLLFSFFLLFFFSGAADEGLPIKQRKVRMKEKIETTSCGMIDAGILWTMTTCFFNFFVSNFVFSTIFHEILSGSRDKFKKRVTCVAFSIEFAKTKF